VDNSRLWTVADRPPSTGAAQMPPDGVDTLIVGPGDRFLSGVSYYTALLTTALHRAAARSDGAARSGRSGVALLQLRDLCPRRAYPGRARVGQTDGVLPLPDVPVLNGLDWYWGRSALRAVRFLRQARPRTVVLQWWTGTVLHSYLPLAWLAKRIGARLVIEFHEVQDVGEATVPLAAHYTRAGMRLLLGMADAAVVHSDYDRQVIRTSYPRLRQVPTEVIPHGPLGDLVGTRPGPTAAAPAATDPHPPADPQPAPAPAAASPHPTPGPAAADPHPTAPGRHPTPAPHTAGPGRPLRLLIFGVIRPYKGHAELAEAVGLLRAQGHDVHVTVVGEVWQNYRRPLELLAENLPADRLRIVDRYVADEEVGPFYAQADLVVLPYHRASASGPLQLAMSLGLPVVTTAVGGLVEAVRGYGGAVLTPPRDPVALAAAIERARPLVGTVHADPHSWERTAARFRDLFDRLDPAAGRADSPSPHALAQRVGAGPGGVS
jgi:glycosyltransferase involved in cell wall biosynthesis